MNITNTLTKNKMKKGIKDYKLTFGTHKSKTLQEVYRETPDYIIWLCSNSFNNDELKPKVKRFLKAINSLDAEIKIKYDDFITERLTLLEERKIFKTNGNKEAAFQTLKLIVEKEFFFVYKMKTQYGFTENKIKKTFLSLLENKK